MTPRDPLFERGLPAAVDEEKVILGSILLDAEALALVGGALKPGDFSLEQHRRIFQAMLALNEAGTPVDRVTVGRWLMDAGQIDSVGGLGYLNSLDEGMPRILNLESYIATIRDKSAKRQLLLQLETLTARLLLDNEPATTVVRAAESALFAVEASESDGDMLTPYQAMAAFPGGVMAFLNPANQPKGLKTGFTVIDDMTAGLHEGDFVIVAGRPGMGKTALAMNIAANVAKAKGGKKGITAVFSLEMMRNQLTTRMVCAEARVDILRYRMGLLNKDERMRIAAAAAVMEPWDTPISDRSGTTVLDVMARCRRLKQTRGLDLIVIDYLQLMGGKMDNRNQELSGISRSLKLMAKDLKVPVLALSQLNRLVETRANQRPQMSDLRESGSLEQDADAVWLVFRPEYYKPDKPELKGLAEVNIAKQRNGPTGTVKLTFLSKCTRFENLAGNQGKGEIEDE